MYSFLRRPLWILSHVLIAILIAVLLSLGFWQRSRYYEELDRKQELEAAAAAEPVDLDEVVDPDTQPGHVSDDAAYTRVRITGVFDVDNEVLVNNRSLDGSPGAWVLTPLVPSTGDEDGGGGRGSPGAARPVAVVRGWVPLATAERGVPVVEAPVADGAVTVTGVVQLTQERGSLGPTDPAEGHLDDLARVDLVRFSRQLPYDLEPVWVLQDGVEPSTGAELPLPVSLQPGDPSQNFSYMFQWWIFASIAIIGYPLIIRSVARHRSSPGGGGGRRRGRMPDEIPWAEGLGPDGPSAGPGEG